MEKTICTHCETDNKPHNKYCINCGYELPTKTIKEPAKPVQNISNEPREKRKKIMNYMLFAIFFFGSYFTVQQIFFKPSSVDEVLTRVASEVNKTAPFMADQFTRFDNAIPMPEKSFMYNYTLVDLEKSEVNLDTVKKYIFPSLINNIKTSPNLKYFRDNKITMIYNYKDKNGVFVLKHTITPDMYE